MSMQSPLTSFCRSFFTNTITFKSRPARLFVLLGLIGVAATGLAATASSSASLRQIIFGGASSLVRTRGAQPKAAMTDRLLADVPAPDGSNMSVERRGHTATLLSDGRVLIVGGENSSGVLNQAEIYDPASASFSAAGNLNTARVDHSATLLSDGRVLVAGGRDSAGAVNTTEIFDPSTGTFTSGSNLSVARAGHSATLFADGRILIAGGDGSGSAEILNLSAGSSATVGANMNDARSGHSAALLQDGRVLIVGGRDAGGNELSSGEIFDPASSSFTGVGGMEVARVHPLLRVLFDGKVQIIGGNDDRSMEIYDPAAGIFGGYAQVPPDGDLHADLINEVMSAPTRAALLTGGQTITELGSSALATGGIDANGNATSAATIYASSGASVSSDKVDYLPGTQVIITGRGFQPNENITLTFHEYPHVDTAELHTFTVQADADGNFTFDQYSPEAADVGITYILGAKGQTSGVAAQTTFHDSVNVTAATGGTNISADRAANATSPAFTILGNIVITEVVATDFAAGNNVTLILTAPNGWQFNAGAGSTTAAKDSGPGANEVSINSTTVTTTTITVNITVGGTAQLNHLTITGIQVRATDGANIPASGNILRTVGNPGTATITGVTNGSTNFGSLSQVAGAINKLVVTLPGQTFTDGSTVAASGNSGSVSNQTAGASFNISKLTATDQFFNVVTSYSGTKTISYTGPGTNVGFTAPSYTTAVNFTSGVSTTTLATTLRKAETTTITASDGTTTGPASSNLTVNAGALSAFAVTNTSDGAIGTQTAGTSFNIKVRAVDAGGNTDTTFNANGFKANITSNGTLSSGAGTTPSFTSGVLASYSITFSTSGSYPGSFTITAETNPNGPETGTSNSFTVNAPACTNPTVTTQPISQTVTYGAASASFTSAASGTPAPTVQWQSSPNGTTWTDIGGATSTTLTINNPTVAMSGTQYRAVFTNTCGGTQTATSNAATLTVNAKNLTISGALAENKVYNGTSTATVDFSGASLVGVVGADSVSINSSAYAANFNTKDVGNTKPVTVTGVTLSGAQAGNYTVAQPIGLTANITAKALPETGLSASNKVYDATTTATLTGTAALLASEAAGAGTTSDGKPYTGDTVGVTGTPTGAFASKDVANGISVTVSGTSLTGAQAANYTLTQQTGLTANITPKALSVSGLSASNKIYDATTAANLTGTATLATAEAPGSGNSSDGKPYTGDTVTISGTPSGTFASKDVGNTIAITVSGNTLSGGQAGNYTLTEQTGLSANITPKAVTVTGLTANNKPYDGTTAATLTGTAALQTAETPGAGTISDEKPYTGDTVSVAGTPSGTFASANVANGINVSVSGLSLSGAQLNNYTLTALSLSANITPATLTASIIGNPTKTYDGNTNATLTSANFSLSGLASGENFTVTKTTGAYNSADVASANTVSTSLLVDDFTPGAGTLAANYDLPTTASGPGQINKANANVTVTPYSVTYDGASHTASYTIGGVNGETGATVGTIDVSNTTHTNAGTYSSDSWSFTGAANYNNIAATTITDTINKADAIVTVTPYNVTYDGASHTASYTIGGVNGETGATVGTIDVSNTIHTDAGTYATDSWSFTGTANYNNIAATTITDTINKANALINVTPYSVTYDGAAHTASGTATGVETPTPVDLSSLLDLSGTTHTNAGNYPIDGWSFAGNSNYNATSSTVHDSIAKAATTTTVTCTPGPFSYTGAAITPCSAAVTGPGGLNETFTVNYTDNVSAGTATASASYAETVNYLGSSDSKTFEITKANTATVVTCPASEAYTGSAITPCRVTVTGANLSLTPAPDYLNNLNVGTATASYNYAGDPNHNGSSDSKNFDITKASSATIVTCPASETYTGSAITPCTVAVTGANLSLTPAPSYSNNINVGPATASYTFDGDANHTGSSDTKNFDITKASSTTVVTCPASETYTGSAITPCSATVTGAGGLNVSVTVVYGNNMNAGTATADATYGGDANHDSSNAAQATFAINKAESTTTVSCGAGPFAFTGSAIGPCSVAVTGAGALNLSPAPVYANNVAAGVNTASASYTFAGDDNHTGSVDSKSFSIEKASSTVTVTCPGTAQTYTGSPLTPCTAEATGVGMSAVSVTSSIVYENNTDVGAATANANWAGDGNHTGNTGNGVFTISQASSTVTVDCIAGAPHTYTGSAQTPCTAQATGAGMSPIDVTASLVYGSNTDVGPATANASWAGDANHTSSNGLGGFSITKANTTTVVTCSAGPFTYTGLAQTPCTASVTGAGGLNQSLTVNYANNTNAGTVTANASFGGDVNHNSSNDSKNFIIDKAGSTTTVTAGSAIFDGLPHGGAATVTGAGALNQSVTPVYYVGRNTTVYPSSTTAPTTAGDYTASATFAGDSNHNSSSGSKDFSIGSWMLTGFYQPVDMTTTSVLVFNTVKGGSTVPLKFNIYAGTPGTTTERKSVSDIASFLYASIPCNAAAAIDTTLEVTTTGGTSLRYDTTAGQFIQNWQTPKQPGICYQVRMTALDGSHIDAFFKTK